MEKEDLLLRTIANLEALEIVVAALIATHPDRVLLRAALEGGVEQHRLASLDRGFERDVAASGAEQVLDAVRQRLQRWEVAVRGSA